MHVSDAGEGVVGENNGIAEGQFKERWLRTRCWEIAVVLCSVVVRNLLYRLVLGQRHAGSHTLMVSISLSVFFHDMARGVFYKGRALAIFFKCPATPQVVRRSEGSVVVSRLLGVWS
jgi:hypothetical protein